MSYSVPPRPQLVPFPDNAVLRKYRGSKQMDADNRMQLQAWGWFFFWLFVIGGAIAGWLSLFWSVYGSMT